MIRGDSIFDLLEGDYNWFEILPLEILLLETLHALQNVSPSSFQSSPNANTPSHYRSPKYNDTPKSGLF